MLPDMVKCSSTCGWFYLCQDVQMRWEHPRLPQCLCLIPQIKPGLRRYQAPAATSSASQMPHPWEVQQ